MDYREFLERHHATLLTPLEEEHFKDGKVRVEYVLNLSKEKEVIAHTLLNVIQQNGYYCQKDMTKIGAIIITYQSSEQSVILVGKVPEEIDSFALLGLFL